MYFVVGEKMKSREKDQCGLELMLLIITMSRNT